MVPDYKFILIDPHQMSEDDFERMNTNLKTVLRAIAYARDKNKIELLEKIYTPLAKIEWEIINKYTGMSVDVPEKKEVKAPEQKSAAPVSNNPAKPQPQKAAQPAATAAPAPQPEEKKEVVSEETKEETPPDADAKCVPN